MTSGRSDQSALSLTLTPHPSPLSITHLSPPPSVPPLSPPLPLPSPSPGIEAGLISPDAETGDLTPRLYHDAAERVCGLGSSQAVKAAFPHVKDENVDYLCTDLCFISTLLQVRPRSRASPTAR